MARSIVVPLAIAGMLAAACWLPSPSLLAEEGTGSGLSEQAKQQLEGKVQELEQFLQELRQERLSRPREEDSELSGEGGCGSFDELGDMWEDTLGDLNDMADRGEIDDDDFEFESEDDDD